MTQLEFDFGPEEAIQKFLTIIETKFQDQPKNGRLEGQYYVKKDWFHSLYISKLRYWADEIEWDYVMDVSQEEVEVLYKNKYVRYW